jgi:hypothetical protein
MENRSRADGNELKQGRGWYTGGINRWGGLSVSSINREKEVKKMKRKWIKMTAYVVLIAFQIFIALPALYAASEKEPPKRLQLSILSFAFGSAAYVLCQGLADLINKHSTWLKASSIETKGTATNALTLALRPETRKTTLISVVAPTTGQGVRDIQKAIHYS